MLVYVACRLILLSLHIARPVVLDGCIGKLGKRHLDNLKCFLAMVMIVD
jgi:hypothetical protein